MTISWFVASLASLLVAQPGVSTELDAPFRIVESSGRLVRVDLGADRSRAKQVRRATVLTPAGAVSAVLVRTERVCQWLCSEGDPETRACHFEAVLSATTRLEQPLAVLGGGQLVERVQSIASQEGRPIEAAESWTASNPGPSLTGETLRWVRSGGGVFLSAGNEPPGPDLETHAALRNCSQRDMAPFTVLRCGDDAELLYDGRRLIIASFAEYGDSAASPELRLRVGGAEAVLIRLGRKAETIPALLVRSADGWRLKYREADYALLC